MLSPKSTVPYHFLIHAAPASAKFSHFAACAIVERSDLSGGSFWEPCNIDSIPENNANQLILSSIVAVYGILPNGEIDHIADRDDKDSAQDLICKLGGIQEEFAFIHIPKNAGNSIIQALKTCPRFRICNHSILLSSVAHLKQVVILRDPVDRFTSAFFYVKNYPRADREIYAQKYGRFQTPEQLVQALLHEDPVATQFLETGGPLHIVNGKKIYTNWVFHPQKDWVDRPHKVILLPYLEEDLLSFTNKIGLKITLPHVNRSKKIEFEYTPESIEYLIARYRDDFELYHAALKVRNNELMQDPESRIKAIEL